MFEGKEVGYSFSPGAGAPHREGAVRYSVGWGEGREVVERQAREDSDQDSIRNRGGIVDGCYDLSFFVRVRGDWGGPLFHVSRISYQCTI